MTLPRWFDPRTMALSPTTVPDEDEEVDEVSIANRGSCNASPVKQMLESTSNKFAASVQVSGFAPTAAAFAAPQAAANVMGPPAPVVRPTTPSPTKKARKGQQTQGQQQAATAESSSRSGRDSIANLLGAGETPPFLSCFVWREGEFFRYRVGGSIGSIFEAREARNRGRCTRWTRWEGLVAIGWKFGLEHGVGILVPKFSRQNFFRQGKFEFRRDGMPLLLGRIRVKNAQNCTESKDI